MSDPTEDTNDPTTQPEGADDAVEPDEETSDEQTEGELSEEEQAKADADKLKEAIDVAIDEIGTLRKRLTITVPKEIVQERLEDQFSELQRQRDVPGFRKGRAPRRLVEKAYGSEVRDLLKDQIASQAYMAAVEKEELDVLGDPAIDFEKIEMPEEGALEFSCEIEVKPDFELPKLEGIPIDKPAVTITEEDIDQQVERLQMRFGNYVPVEDAEIQADDLVTADVKITVGDTTLFEQTNEQFAARPSRIEDFVLDNLGDDLAGAKVGETRTVEVDVPDDYEVEEHRGKKAEFTFTIRDIKRLDVPELNDEFAQMLGLENVDELRTMIRAESESHIDQEIQRGMREQIRKYLAENTELDVPAGLSSRQTQRVVQQQVVDMQRQGLPDVEIEKRLDELQTTAQEAAATEIKMFFILEKLAEEFDITVTEDEINGQVAQIAQRMNRRFDRVRDELARHGRLQALYVRLREEKVIDRLLQDAEITEVSREEADESPAEADDKKKSEKSEQTEDESE